MKLAATMCMFALTMCMQGQKSGVKLSTAKSDTNPSANWIMIHKDGMVGYMDRNGTVVVPPLYDEIAPFGAVKEGIAIIQSPAGLKGFIGTTGQVVLEPKYNFIENANQYNRDWLKVELDGFIGFIDLNGNEVVPPVYDDVEPPHKITSGMYVKLETVK